MKKNEVLEGVLISAGILTVASVITVMDYKKHEWKCNYCDEEFKPSIRDYLLSTHTPTRRYLSCPMCGNKGFFKAVKKK